MGLESGTYVGDLVETNPIGAVDIKGEGDNHLRLIKTVLKNTFPGMAGRAFRKQTKSGSYTVVANDNISVIQATAALTLNLTAAATLGNGHMFFADANRAAITLDPNGSETINGLSTLVVPLGWLALVFCDGGSFFSFVTPVASGTTATETQNSFAAGVGGVQRLAFVQEDQAATPQTGEFVVIPGFPACTLLSLRAFSVTPSTIAVTDFDVEVNGVSILSSPLRIDVNCTSSLQSTTQPTISSAEIPEGCLFSIDLDTLGTGAKGVGVIAVVRWKEGLFVLKGENITVSENVTIRLNPELFSVFDTVTVTDSRTVSIV